MTRGALLGMLISFGGAIAGFVLGMPWLGVLGLLAGFGFGAVGLARRAEANLKEKIGKLDSRGRAQIARLERAREKLRALAVPGAVSYPIAEAALFDADEIIAEARRLLEQRSRASELARKRSLVEHEVHELRRKVAEGHPPAERMLQQREEQLKRVTAAEESLAQTDAEIDRAESEMTILHDTIAISTTQSASVNTDDLRSLVDRLKSLSHVVDEAETMLEHQTT